VWIAVFSQRQVTWNYSDKRILNWITLCRENRLSGRKNRLYATSVAKVLLQRDRKVPFLIVWYPRNGESGSPHSCPRQLGLRGLAEDLNQSYQTPTTTFSVIFLRTEQFDSWYRELLKINRKATQSTSHDNDRKATKDREWAPNPYLYSSRFAGYRNAAVKVLLSVIVLELIDVHLTDANALKLK